MSKDKSGSSLARLGPILFVGGGVVLGVVFIYLTVTSSKQSELAEAVRERSSLETRALGNGDKDEALVGTMPKMVTYSSLMGSAPAAPSPYAGTGYYDILIKDIPRDRSAASSTDNTDSTDPIEPEKPKTVPALAAPTDVKAARLSGHPGIAITWQAGALDAEAFEAPADRTYVVYRGVANAEGKVEGSMEILNDQPLTGMTFMDLHAPMGHFVYAVVECTETDITEGVAGRESVGRGEATKRLNVSAKALSTAVDGATDADIGVGENWFIGEYNNDRTKIDVHFQRWFFADRRNKPGVWLRVNLIVKQIPTGSQIGENFKMSGVLTGRARVYDCVLKVEYFDGSAFVTIDPSALPTDNEMAVDAWNQFRRVDSLDVTTGYSFSHSKGGNSPAFVFRTPQSTEFEVEIGKRTYQEKPVMMPSEG